MAPPLKPKTVKERFYEKVLLIDRWFTTPDGIESPCMEWQGHIGVTTKRGGYGKFTYVASHPQKCMAAHRWSYEHFEGPIPKGLVLDHLCLYPACVNPLHLEPVTVGENNRRAWLTKDVPPDEFQTRRYTSAWRPYNVLKEFCDYGHKMTKDNGIYVKRRTTPTCKQCRNRWHRERMKRKRAKARAEREALGVVVKRGRPSKRT